MKLNVPTILSFDVHLLAILFRSYAHTIEFPSKIYVQIIANCMNYLTRYNLIQWIAELKECEENPVQNLLFLLLVLFQVTMLFSKIHLHQLNLSVSIIS